MKAYPHLNPSVHRRRSVAGSKGLLDFDGTSGCIDGTRKLHEKAITDGVKLLARKLGENRAQNFPMRSKQFDCKSVVLLNKRAIAHHIGEHEGGKLTLFSTHQKVILRLVPRRLCLAASNDHGASLCSSAFHSLRDRQRRSSGARGFIPRLLQRGDRPHY